MKVRLLFIRGSRVASCRKDHGSQRDETRSEWRIQDGAWSRDLRGESPGHTTFSHQPLGSAVTQFHPGDWATSFAESKEKDERSRIGGAVVLLVDSHSSLGADVY